MGDKIIVTEDVEVDTVTPGITVPVAGRHIKGAR